MLSRIELRRPCRSKISWRLRPGTRFKKLSKIWPRAFAAFSVFFPRINLPQFVNYEFYNLLLVKFEM